MITQNTRPLALTQGDPRGVGLEITLKAFRAREAAKLPPFAALGDPSLFADAAAALAFDAAIEEATLETATEIFARALPVVPLKRNRTGAAATIASIEFAVEAVAQGRARAVVTNPI
ncbi:MAG TPA: 4-hydroxythreonine-4-phosphate dehydrogenase, partial [Methylocystis sp.]|nr:4-hydroxythreonine-4-phosphate dehydrogenase [Methylocystis sp.]